MEIQRIPFVPDFQYKNIYARNIEDKIHDTLKGEIDQFRGVRVLMTEEKISVQIAISSQSSTIERDPVSRIGNVENPYILSEGLKKTLEPFLDITKPIKSFIVKGKKEPSLVVELNSWKVINAIIEPAEEGYEYSIIGIIPQKNNSIMQLAKGKIKKYQDKDNSDRRGGYKGNNYDPNYHKRNRR